MKFDIQPVIFQDEDAVVATVHDADLPGVDGYIGMIRFTKEQFKEFHAAVNLLPGSTMLLIKEPKYYAMHKKAPQPQRPQPQPQPVLPAFAGSVEEARALIEPMKAVMEFILMVTPQMPPDRLRNFQELIAKADKWLAA